MAWYRAGTVTVTNGSAAVVGAGTDFVSNVNSGDAFLGPDGRVYEVATVVSATQLTLASTYMGGGAGGQGYAVSPTQSFARDLALGATQLLNTFAAVRDGIGQGLIPDGTVGAPAVRFAADQDTGIYRNGNNVLVFGTGGIARFWMDGNGRAYSTAALTNIGSTDPALRTIRTEGSASNLVLSSTFAGGTDVALNSGVTGISNSGFEVAFGGSSKLVIDGAGNLLVGVASGAFHRINRTAFEGAVLLAVGASGVENIAFYHVGGGGYSVAAAGLKIGLNSATNRSINAGGTINASGADYAEYMTKADGCGTIAPGDVCGVTVEGELTRTWADAISFVVKSTDPAYVGGDSWAADLPPRPEQDEDELPSVFAARTTAWEADLEAARVKVDRIAFAGQVPVNVSGDFAAGDYLIAAANGGGIKAVSVPEADITFDQYRRRLGRVWAVRDGRAWIDVQHG